MNNLRKLRKAQGLSMRALGNKIGLAESTISLYETGKRQPDNATLIKLAETLNCSVDYLLGLSDNKKTPADLTANERDKKIIEYLSDLSPAEADRVRDFVAGLLAARSDDSSQNH